MKIFTITFNPSLDKYGETDSLKWDDVTRMEACRTDPGGKGINVSRVLKRFSVPNACLGFAGGSSGEKLEQLLKQESLETRFTGIEKETRNNLAVFDRSRKEVLKLNEPGPEVSGPEKKTFLEQLGKLADEDSVFVLTGSLPVGCGPEFTEAVLGILEQKGSRLFLDADGVMLENIMKNHRPDFVKPNRHEAERLAGTVLDNTGAVVRFAENLAEKVRVPFISLGAEGIVFPENGKWFLAVPPVIEPKSSVGAGDSFIAGYLAAIYQGQTHRDAVILGCAVSCATVKAGRLSYPEEAEAVLPGIVIKPVK